MPTTDSTAAINEKGVLSSPSEEIQRIAPANVPILNDLGVLSELPGTWVGTGFNVIALPDKQDGRPFRLKLNATIETLDFEPIGGPVPNRGSEQNDIFLHGIHYLQRVSDALTHSALHIEPGFWLNVPATVVPDLGPTVVRQASIPHGDSLVAQSTFTGTVNGGPVLSPVDAIPFTIMAGTPIPGLNQVPNPNQLTNPGYLAPFTQAALPAGLPPGLNAAATIQNPVLVLKAAIQGQEITKTTVIQISTDLSGGIVNIPFVVKNANAVRMDAIFWIETVHGPSGTFQQLQYVQRVILDFIGIHWPHISVATLVKQ